MRMNQIWLPVISRYQPAPSDLPLQDRELLLRVRVLMRGIQLDPVEIRVREPFQAPDIVDDVKMREVADRTVENKGLTR